MKRPHYGTPIKIAATIVAFGCGYFGLLSECAVVAEHSGWVEVFYKLIETATQTWSLVAFGLAPSGMSCHSLDVWPIRIARIGVPVSLAFLMAPVAFGYVARVVRPRQAILRGGHALVFGSTELAREIARDERRKGRGVIIVDRQHDDALDRFCAENRIGFRPLADPIVASFARLGLNKAAAVHVALAGDVASVDVALAVAEQWKPGASSRSNTAPVITVHVGDQDLLEQFSETLSQRTDLGHAEISLYSLPVLVVRKLFRDQPISRFRRTGIAPHFVIVGNNAISRQICLALLRCAHGPGSDGPAVTLIAPDGQVFLTEFRDRYPGVEKIGDLAGSSVDVRASGAAGQLEQVLSQRPPPTAIYICQDVGNDSVACALVMSKVFATKGWVLPPVCIHLPEHAAAAEALRRAAPLEFLCGLVGFGSVEWLMGDGLVLLDELDRTACAIHERYQAQTAGAGGGTQSRKAWRRLPESFRNANRHQAQHIPLKLASIGCRTVIGAGPSATISAAEREMLAEVEHRRWAAVTRRTQ
jgi:hypothetical protein